MFQDFYIYLVSSAYQIKSKAFIEAFNDVMPVNIRDASLAWGPTTSAFVWIRPQQISNQPIIWDF